MADDECSTPTADQSSALLRHLVGIDPSPEADRALRDAWDGLDSATRTVLMRSLCEGQTLREAGGALGLHGATVQQMRTAGLRNLTWELRSRLGAHDPLSPPIRAADAEVMAGVGIGRMTDLMWTEPRKLKALTSKLPQGQAYRVNALASLHRRLTIQRLRADLAGALVKRAAVLPIDREADAHRLVNDEGLSLRAAGAQLGLSHTHVARLVENHHARRFRAPPPRRPPP